MSMLKEFKTFALRGNVVDMAVGIIIGAAFGKVVSSFVTNVVMPPLGLMIGLFIQSIVDFLIIAAAIFMAVRVMNSLKRKEEAAPAAPPAPSKEEVLLSEIRDLLKQQNS